MVQSSQPLPWNNQPRNEVIGVNNVSAENRTVDIAASEVIKPEVEYMSKADVFSKE